MKWKKVGKQSASDTTIKENKNKIKDKPKPKLEPKKKNQSKCNPQNKIIKKLSESKESNNEASSWIIIEKSIVSQSLNYFYHINHFKIWFNLYNIFHFPRGESKKMSWVLFLSKKIFEVKMFIFLLETKKGVWWTGLFI